MGRLDANEIRAVASGRWVEIISRLGGIPSELLDGRHHPCPKCGGTDRFRLIDEKAGSVLCNQCFSKENGDGFAAIAWMLGQDFKTTLKAVADYLGVKTASSTDPAKDLEFQPWSSELVAFYLATKSGVTEEALLANGARLARYKRKYTVIALPIIGETLNPEKPVGWVIMDAMGGKLPKWDKQGSVVGMVSSKSTAYSKGGLLGTHGVERLKLTGMVEFCWKAEGVTDLLAIWACIPKAQRDQHVVVSNSSGAMEQPRWRASLLAHIPDALIIQDSDEPGLAGSLAWCNAIADVGGRARNVRLPYDLVPCHGKDVRDWLNEGHDYTDLQQLANQAKIFSKLTGDPTVPIEERNTIEDRILKVLQLEVLYENDAGWIRVFSTLLRKSSWIKHVDRLKQETLIQVCGETAIKHISADPGNTEDEFKMLDVKRAIALIAARRREQNVERGIGVWQGIDASGAGADCLILVGDTEAARMNGSAELVRVVAPRSDGLVLDFGGGGRDWYEYDSLAESCKQATDPEWAKSVIETSVRLFSQWSWSNEVVPLLVSGLAMASWVQTIWHWRPLVSISGGTNTGKSVFFDTLGGNDWQPGIFGRLSFKQSRSTEAGMRQGLRNTGRVLLCDEFEDSAERKRILEMMRLSTRGDQTARGTAGDQMGRVFVLRHIAWVAAIESGLNKTPDANRFIQLELRVPTEYKMNLPDGRSLADLGQKMLALATVHGLAAKAMASALKRTTCPGIDHRQVESYSVPAAMLAVVAGGDEDAGRSILIELLRNVESDSQGSSDHGELLLAIYGARITASGGIHSVAQILSSPALMLSLGKSLEACGIAVENTSEGRNAVIHPSSVKESLLKGTDWAGQRIDQILARAPGATRKRASIFGQQHRVVVVPIPPDDPTAF